MTGGSLIFWGILIFIGLTFDQYNSKKKKKQKSNRLQINKQLFLLAD